MAIWKATSSVEVNGTSSIKSLVGRRVRTTRQLQGFLTFNPSDQQPQTIDLQRAEVGFIANPHPTRNELLIAFPKDQSKQFASLDALSRAPFKVVVVNIPTFKVQFEIEG